MYCEFLGESLLICLKKDPTILYVYTMYGNPDCRTCKASTFFVILTCVYFLPSVPANPPVAENSDVSSVRSMATLQSQSSAPTPAPDEGLGSHNQAGLYLIRCLCVCVCVCVCSGTLIKGHL